MLTSNRCTPGQCDNSVPLMTRLCLKAPERGSIFVGDPSSVFSVNLEIPFFSVYSNITHNIDGYIALRSDVCRARQTAEIIAKELVTAPYLAAEEPLLQVADPMLAEGAAYPVDHSSWR